MRYARAGGRIVVLAIFAGGLGIVGVQFEHAIASNIAVGRELDQTRRDVADLQMRGARDRREIVRLSDPEGSVPEIHARLRLVGPHEELIYLRHVPAHPATAP